MPYTFNPLDKKFKIYLLYMNEQQRPNTAIYLYDISKGIALVAVVDGITEKFISKNTYLSFPRV